MDTKKVFICRPIPEIAEQILRQAGIVVVKNEKDEVLSQIELKRAVKGVDGILSLLSDKIDAGVLDAAGKQLKIVANYAVGFDNIDIEGAKKRGVAITNTPGVLTESVAEHTIALMLAVARRVAEADKFVRDGKYKQWEPLGFLGPQIWGKALGVIGLGRIGSFVAGIAYHGFHMKILYYDLAPDERFEMDTDAKFCAPEEIYKEADFISLHLPLTPQTKHLISQDQFRAMKKSVILINTARGPIVDEQALVEALEQNEIAGVGLDVFEQEPEVSAPLKKMDNVVLTPHIASATREARDAMAKIAAENIVEVLNGRKPLSPVY
ncbi:MAG: NAD-binding D-isomer specific 2-hydroxyacid dehydrogenase [Candidatus Berkelbacteria bacterium Licking1014_7]|uniref:NAD-binding D-isomer specific 2-hydroxyacid dehydrogenase n=1 Tax=Candidatus Berkelbacteria bacterium Licking1014_7 TaxID=2017147 RepID=A0A554LI87_9BACT|nr:MAG: NAD-binding D-isomer specific 2-hydroxyacid dehydrogenase [Candidatus Berkelbacteria bacterium Licking1014_7]